MGSNLRAALILTLALASPLLFGTAPGSPTAPEVRFERPMVTGAPVATCLAGSQGCGSAAATAWCQWRGFADAAGFEAGPAPSEGAMALGTGTTCEGAGCRAFRSITCAGMPGA